MSCALSPRQGCTLRYFAPGAAEKGHDSPRNSAPCGRPNCCWPLSPWVTPMSIPPHQPTESAVHSDAAGIGMLRGNDGQLVAQIAWRALREVIGICTDASSSHRTLGERRSPSVAFCSETALFHSVWSQRCNSKVMTPAAHQIIERVGSVGSVVRVEIVELVSV